MFNVADKGTFIALHPAELSPPSQPDGTDSRTGADRKIADAFKTGHHRFEWVHRRRNREDFPAEVWLTAFELEGRTVLQATVRDITERKGIEEKYRRLVENLGKEYFFYRHNPQGIFTYVSPSIREMLGYSPEEFLTHYREYMTDNPVNAEVDRLTAQCLLGNPQPPYETELFHKNGHRRMLEVSETPVRDVSGQIVGVEGLAHDITESKRAEEALRASERRFRAIIDQTYQFIGLLTTEGILIDVNETALSFSGIAKADVLDKPFWEGPWWTHSAELQAKVRDAVKRVASGDFVRFEATHPAKDGSLHFVDFSLKPVRDDTGKIILLLPEGRDITERKQIEEALRRSEEEYRLLFDNAGDAIFIHSPAGKMLAVNRVACERLGYTLEEMMSLGPSVVDTPEEAAHVAGRISELLEKGRIVFQTAHRRKDGSFVPTEVNAQLVAFNNEPAVMAICRDITERKEAEETLRESEHRLADILQFYPDPTMVIDREGRVTAWNQAIEELSGVKAQDMLGKGNYEYALPFYGERRQILIDLALQADPEVEKRYTTIARRGEILMGEAYTPHLPSGKVHLSATASVLRDSEGRVVGAIESIRDNTERKQMEEALNQAKKEADSANRAKSDFLANMSHEIRTPMNGILGMLNLALDTSLSEEQREYLVLAKSSADSLLMLINDILDFSKIEAKKLDLEDVDFELEGVIGEILPLLGVETDRKGLEFVCEIDPAVPPVLRGDPLRLKQVLINLLKNAIKFTEKGHILLKAQAEGEWEPGFPKLHFSVTDTGIGIPPEKQRLIFDSFTQSESSMTRKYGGTGLGLTISRSLVEMMGGALWVESRQGEGSTFHFTTRFRRGACKAETRQKRIPDLRGKRVLVVDDHAVNRMSLRKYLESWEMEVTEATDGFDGLEKIRGAERENRPYPFMILDCMMPDLDGFGVIETLRRQGECRSCIIFMLSSLDQQGDRARCRNLGVAQFLVKPISPSSLFNAILQALDQSQKREEDKPLDSARPEELTTLSQDMKVLVAEDNPVNQKLATRLLDKIGLSAQTAVNGVEVLKALEQGRYDLILMDVQMPEMDGVEATKRIREREERTGEHVPIVALTAHSLVGDRERFLEAGMDDYLSKPISAAELYQMVRKYIPRRAAPSRGNPPVSGEKKAGEEAPLLALDDLRNRMAGDEGVIREIFQIFLEEIAQAQEKVNEALKQRDPAGPLRSVAHYFKGMSANISATALREAFQELEQRAAGGDVGDLGGLLERLWVLEKRTAGEIKAYLDQG
jgi:PAS domain S-box-containing protein